MSKNKSYLPNGGYTLTQGSNYMMDGFQFDTEYNGGPLEKARLPEAKGLSDLPSGMIPLDSSGASTLPNGLETQFDLNMDELTKEANQQINLVDHSWLAKETELDLSGQQAQEDVFKGLEQGHMNNDTFNQIQTLEKAWGQTSTTGLDIIPNSNRQHEPYSNPYRKDQSQLPGDDYRQRMEKSVRKLAYGHSMKEVLSEVIEKDVVKMKTKLASEYGLHGQVYIKEEYFPGLFNGKWNEVINKRCATSMYIIPKNKDCAYDRFLGMEVVNEIPWKKASKNLLPRLESYGVKVATGSSKFRLKKAFIDLIEGRVANQSMSPTWFPTQKDQTNLVSLDYAQRELQETKSEKVHIASVEERELSKIEKRLNRIATQLVSQGFLESTQVNNVLTSNKSASQKIDKLYTLASSPKKASKYEGDGKNASYHIINPKPKNEVKEVKDTQYTEGKKIASNLKSYIQNGMITKEDADHALSLSTEESRYKSLYNLAKKATLVKKSDFSGVKYTAHIAKRASTSTKTAHEAQSDKVATWLKQKISEGSAGEELDMLLATRFSQEVLKSHGDRISSIRSEHEGISGHAYVDASAYLTKGTEGCDKGALVHRANQIPTVMKTAKCGTCVFNSGGSCQKYNKPIVASVNEIVENPKSYQREMIRLANASDSEQTASLFVNNYDANEFNLTANQDVSVNEDTPSSDKLGEILFGGFDV